MIDDRWHATRDTWLVTPDTLQLIKLLLLLFFALLLLFAHRFSVSCIRNFFFCIFDTPIVYMQNTALSFIINRHYSDRGCMIVYGFLGCWYWVVGEPVIANYLQASWQLQAFLLLHTNTLESHNMPGTIWASCARNKRYITMYEPFHC